MQNVQDHHAERACEFCNLPSAASAGIHFRFNV